ncbi:MAG: hypothetical protein K0B81_00995 [Candidatus Cloacimonetes bacterium]|nr:hypothetical protein [Candidatus Cloacimonadota bacterium]
MKIIISLSALWLILFFSVGICYAQFQISGLNEAQYIYKSAQDSLSSYFYNETLVRLNYQNIEAGISFIAELPKYDQFQPIQDLRPSDIDYRWDERYIQLNLTDLRLRAGSFSEFFGNGILLRSYRDKTFDHDTRLTGINMQMSHNSYQFKGLYGSLPNEFSPNNNDLIAGLDLTAPINGTTQLGLSLTSQQLRRTDNRYSTRIAAGGRIEVITDFFDFNSEYGESKSYRTFGRVRRGQAFYGFANTYIGPFTISGGYKNYDRFDDRMNDLPTLNASEEPLSERFNPGYDEEGLLGQIRYNPSITSQLGVTYSEAWNSDFSIRQSDLLLEGRKFFPTFTLGLEYAQLETIDKEWELWLKEITPAIMFDFNLMNLPTHLRTEFGYKEKVQGESTSEIYNPLLQFDLFFNKFSLSLISELEFYDLNELEKNRTWLGMELSTGLFSHTDMKLFIGEEKGGKVCRSGVCYYTSPFKGLRLDLTTRF